MKDYIFLLFLFLVVNSFSQNLIFNGGFETYKKCPDNMGRIKYASGWENQNDGTGDYFNTCTTNQSIMPKDRPQPHTGNGYAGFCSIREQCFEFIQTKLLNPLNPEMSYCLELYINKASQRNITEDDLALLFSKSENKSTNCSFHSDMLIRENNLVIYSLPRNVYNKWIAVRAIYKPKANEQFLTIGLSKKKMDSLRIQQPYYYIDDISLTEIKNGEKCSCTDSIATDYSSAKDKPLTLKNITFQTNSAVLLEASYQELNSLAVYIKANPKLNMELSGHTDNVGKEEDNMRLSGLRAKAVADYLIQQGIGKGRISYKGYGSKRPLVDNTTETNKLKNRRVEIVFR